MPDAMLRPFLARVLGRGRMRRTDVKPGQGRKMQRSFRWLAGCTDALYAGYHHGDSADSGSVIGRRNTGVWLLARDILADGAS